MGQDILSQTRFYITKTDPLELESSQKEVAFIGRSNVGKSSLLCALAQNKKLARVSNTPGRTRAINVFEVKRGRWLVDLPGYGYAETAERLRDYLPKMIGLYLASRPNLVRVYVLIDAEVGVGEIDTPVLEWLRSRSIPVQVVGTKVDRLGQVRQAEQKAAIATQAGLPPEQLAWVSSKEGYGMKAFRRDVMTALDL